MHRRGTDFVFVDRLRVRLPDVVEVRQVIALAAPRVMHLSLLDTTMDSTMML